MKPTMSVPERSSFDNSICPLMAESHDKTPQMVPVSDHNQTCYWDDVIGCGGTATMICPVHPWYGVCARCQHVDCYGCAVKSDGE